MKWKGLTVKEKNLRKQHKESRNCVSKPRGCREGNQRREANLGIVLFHAKREGLISDMTPSSLPPASSSLYRLYCDCVVSSRSRRLRRHVNERERLAVGAFSEERIRYAPIRSAQTNHGLAFVEGNRDRIWRTRLWQYAYFT